MKRWVYGKVTKTSDKTSNTMSSFFSQFSAFTTSCVFACAQDDYPGISERFSEYLFSLLWLASNKNGEKYYPKML